MAGVITSDRNRRRLTGYTPTLITDTTYYWAITATDGISTSVSPTWRFSTVGWKHVYLPLVLRQ